MGMIRSGLAIFLSSILFISIFFGNVFLTLTWSLEYDNVEPVVLDFANKLVDDMGFLEILDENYDMMLIYCEGYDSFDFTYDGGDISIPCSEIERGTDAVSEYVISDFIDNVYYRDYNCSFFECIKEEGQPYVLISEKARDYWSSKFRLTLLISAIILGLMFLVFSSKHSVLIVAGILSAISALPFRKVNWLVGLLPSGNFADLLQAFFTKSYNVFMIMLIVGGSLLFLGLMFEFLGWGIGISKFFGLFNKKKKENKGSVKLSGESEELKEEIDSLKEEIKELKENKD